jgi:hypothetical protein
MQDEFALRFVFELPSESPEVKRAPIVGQDFARRWHWRHVLVADRAKQAVVEATAVDDEATQHRFEWFDDDDARVAYMTSRMAALGTQRQALKSIGMTHVLAEIRDLKTLELGKVRAFPDRRWTQDFIKRARAEPWVPLPNRPSE